MSNSLARTRHLVLSLSVAAFGLACEAPGALPGERDILVDDAPRAQGIYIPVHVEPRPTFGAFAAGGAPLPLFLNRFGGTYVGGNDDSSQNRSSVVGQGSATVSAFGGGDAVWNATVQCVQEQFAAFNAVVTDVEPASGDYVEAVIGGSPQQVGLPQGVGGVAPIDPNNCNIIPNAVVYVFSGALPNNAQVLCEVAAQEIAHALSLDHELLCEDPMTYLSGCGAKSFQDVAAQCGEFSARECICNRPSQSSVQVLYDKLGPASGEPPPPPVEDLVPPQVSVVSPANGGSLPPNSQIQVVAQASDDVGLGAVELLWAYSGDTFGCPTSGQGFSCAASNGTYTWTLNVGTGERTFQVRARDVGGNVVTTEPRTITLADNGGEPPPPPVDDNTNPEVGIASPADGATLQANSVIQVVATASDDVELASVEIEWDFSGDTFACPTQQQAVTCTQAGSTFTWSINVGSGERTFRVRATDTAGNTSVTGARTISLSDAPPPAPEDDAYEDNDTWDTATPVPCASGIDMIALPGDDDWLRVSVAEGVEVTASVTSNDGATLDVELASGPRTGDVLDGAEGTGPELLVSGLAPYSIVGVRVRASSAEGGAYRAVVTCNDVGAPVDPPTDPTDPGDPSAPNDPNEPAGLDLLADPRPRVQAPEGCAQSTGGSPLALALGLLAGAAIRRRRRA